MQFNGHEIELTLIKMAYWVGGNPFSHQQDRNEMLRAGRLEDFLDVLILPSLSSSLLPPIHSIKCIIIQFRCLINSIK